MLDAELAEIVANLRLLGTDIADVEVKSSRGGLPKQPTTYDVRLMRQYVSVPHKTL
jgi:hypothetical protein